MLMVDFMDKRYQVFVSSTFTDLQEERQNVMQTLMEMDCIPAGMELFPAADEEQWEFIKKIINDCDYYLLIIGGRYGSLTNDGISYTEKEFDYAVSQGIKVVALIHEDPENLVVSKSEIDPIKIEKLNKFKEKVKTGRMVKFWKTTSELSGMMALSLNKTMTMYPGIGWVRANQVASNELLTEINQLRKENEKLKDELQKQSNEIINAIDNIASLDDKFILHGTYDYDLIDPHFGYIETPTKKFKYEISWREIFTIISAYILTEQYSSNVNNEIAKRIVTSIEEESKFEQINDYDFESITVQFLAYELIQITSDENGLSKWHLSDKGKSLMLQLRTQKSISNES